MNARPVLCNWARCPTLSDFYFWTDFCAGWGDLVSFFYMICIWFSQNHLLKRLSFLQCVFLSLLSKIRWLRLCEFLSTLLYYICQCFYCVYSLKSHIMIPLALFFLIKIVLAIQYSDFTWILGFLYAIYSFFHWYIFIAHVT